VQWLQCGEYNRGFKNLPNYALNQDMMTVPLEPFWPVK